jgi:hypothetical protein
MPTVIEAWHDLVRRNDPEAIGPLLAEGCVFLSPVVHRPQLGRALTEMYLRAALGLLNVPGFHYTGEWASPGSAVLEFEGVVDGVTVNGVDMIWWNDANLITRFKVMVRPLKAINLIHAHMGRMLEALAPTGPGQ